MRYAEERREAKWKSLQREPETEVAEQHELVMAGNAVLYKDRPQVSSMDQSNIISFKSHTNTSKSQISNTKNLHLTEASSAKETFT